MQRELTSRQIQVGRLIAENKTFQEIADQLDVSYGTIKATVREMRWKLDVDKARQIPAALRQHGYIN